MAVIVKKFTVQFNGEKYGPGKTIEGLETEEEKRLVEEGYCDNASSSTFTSEDPPKTIPSGEKIKDSNGGTGEGEGGPNTEAPLA